MSPQQEVQQWKCHNFSSINAKQLKHQQKTMTSSILHQAGSMTATIDAIATILLLFQVKDIPLIMTTTYEPYLLLIFVQNDPTIAISCLLLPRNFERPAIMTATYVDCSLQLIGESVFIEAHQVAPATICNGSLSWLMTGFWGSTISSKYVWQRFQLHCKRFESQWSRGSTKIFSNFQEVGSVLFPNIPSLPQRLWNILWGRKGCIQWLGSAFSIWILFQLEMLGIRQISRIPDLS